MTNKPVFIALYDGYYATAPTLQEAYNDLANSVGEMVDSEILFYKGVEVHTTIETVVVEVQQVREKAK